MEPEGSPAGGARKTFTDIAHQLSIPRCAGCDVFDHRGGTIGDGLVHWADRVRVERSGIRRFLKLAAILQVSQTEARPWARLYLAQRFINQWGAAVGADFPAYLRQQDQTELKAMLVNVPTNEPLRTEAMAWALGK